MNWTPWQFTNPFIPYSRIQAEEVNPKFNGISASFTYVADELNQYRPRLPLNFTGNVQCPEGNYFDTLLAIDDKGDMQLVDKTEFQLALDKDLTIKKSSQRQVTIDGNNHSDFFVMQYAGQDNIEIIVGEAIGHLNDADKSIGNTPGATVLFIQDSDTPMTFTAIPGVEIKTPGLLQAFGKNSTVGLVAIDQYTWLLCGDILPEEVII